MSKRAFFELAANEKYGTKRYILAVNKTDGDGKLRSLKELEDVALDLLHQFTGEDNPKRLRMKAYDEAEVQGLESRGSHDGAVLIME
jgi:hypothetical protein